jgi:hypothetical protein
MAGSAHEVLIATLREKPSLLGALVAALTSRSLPRGLEPVDAAVRFVKTAEIRLDLLFARKRRDWTIVEVQRRRDPAKRRRWLMAAGVLLDQTRVLGDVIVITARRDVARWALVVAHLETRLGTKLTLTPVVLHLGEREAHVLLEMGRPELALFAAWAMHDRHGPKAKAVVEQAIEVTSRLPAPLRRAQLRAIVSVLSARMFAWLREASMNPDKIPESTAARKFRLFLEARGRKQGRIEGEAKGEAKGEARGRAEGEVKGKQGALLALLKARPLPVSAQQRAIIRACADPGELDRWIVRAATAASADEVLAPKAKPRARRAPRRPAGMRATAARRV